ncbi:hypothetical protein [Allobranchiibius sp. CTAmp26]|uniref:hypothetical protein n=1 Tax=Allobranchiibius sp. CTAmp26 TaxID=2815214 RepID=UPI001AA12671|nr:hypothetical protein [Allobranchiibius sp. CTAmp26]MBO1756883.1 hypothetical protein [Allobranchiibius sp. CTAmp26]
MTPFEQVIVQGPDGQLRVDVKPSGVIGWNYDAPDSGSRIELVLLLAAFLANCVGRLAHRGGSTVWVYGVDGRRKHKQRFPRTAAAEEAQLALIPVLTERGFAALES